MKTPERSHVKAAAFPGDGKEAEAELPPADVGLSSLNSSGNAVGASGNGIEGGPPDFLMLGSNSYLDLADVDELKRAMADAVMRWGTGSGGSRLTTGNRTPHLELEAEIAGFKGVESAVLFNTGYMANLGTISALCGRGDFIFSDALNHASIIDGIRLSRARCLVYRHGDMADLERVICEAKSEAEAREASCGCDSFRGMIVTDAVFSMDGDLANLPELLRISRKHGILLMTDEAHATGVVGRTGRGLPEYYGCDHADVTVGTLSKAVAVEGGFAAGRRDLAEFLRNRARSFIFTTAMAPASAAAALCNLRFMEAHPDRVRRLRENVDFFCSCLRRQGVSVPASESAIVPIIIGSELKALRVSAVLEKEGILIPAIRYPTVGRGSARLRASIMATHSREELERAARAIAAAVEQCSGEGDMTSAGT